MNPGLQPPATRVSVLTPEGRGAIAIVRVWGPQAVAIADRAFRPMRGDSLAETAPGRLRFGRVGTALGDEVVAVIVGETSPEVEIQCHGGSAAVALVLDALIKEGAERRQPSAWIQHAARSTVAAEAAVDLMRAETTRTAEILLEQAQGALENEIQRAFASLDVDPRLSFSQIQQLIDRSALGLKLISGWRVVLAGRPNVGKSRLLNALAGYARAIVAPTPGTTRDIVTVRTALDGWPVELADTAGLRHSNDTIEATGIALARTRQQAADLVLVVLDGSEPLTESDRLLLEATPRALIVANKCDLPSAWDPSPWGALAISAEYGQGIDELGLAIAARLVPEPPAAGAGVPFRPSHVRILQRILESLEHDDVLATRRLFEAAAAPRLSTDQALGLV